MRRRFIILGIAGGLTLGLAFGGAALAQAEAERRLDAAIERLRASLGAGTRITWARRELDPASGSARLFALEITRPDGRITASDVLVREVTDARLGRAEFRDLVMAEGDKGDRATLDSLVLGDMALPAPGAALDLTRFDIGVVEAAGLNATGATGTLTLGRFVAQGYAPGRLGQAVVEGLAYQAAGAGLHRPQPCHRRRRAGGSGQGCGR